jgi:hypothetical protein
LFCRGQELSPAYQPATGQPAFYGIDSPDQAHQPTQPTATSYYAKYSSVKQTSTSSTTNSGHVSGREPLDRPAVTFPHQQARSPTPQSPPKRVEELMSEFREFESAHGGGGSPTPPMFGNVRPTAGSSNNNTTVVVTELPDGEDETQPDRRHLPAAAASQRLRDDVSPPRGPAGAAGTKGPEVYYPPGADFGKTAAARPVADGGSQTVDGQHSGGGAAKAAKQSRAARADRYGTSDGADKQGAAVIPICLPLCCAAPCVIM